MALIAHLHSFPSEKLERTIEALIDICDLIDGEPEREDDDPDSENENRLGDVAYTEWHSRGRHKATAGGYEQADQRENDEDDDPDTSAEDAPEASTLSRMAA